MRRLAAVLLATFLVGCAGQAGSGTTAAPSTSTAAEQPTTGTSRAPSPPTTVASEIAEYVDNFEFVWETINESFYDPEFGGMDWDAVRDRYVPQLATLDDERELLELINQMVFELEVSHLFVMPPDADFVDPVLTTEGELGLKVRLLDDQWVITEVESGSPAAGAGLSPGYLLDGVGGQPVADVAASGPVLPPLHERGIRSSKILAVEELLYGEPGATTTVEFRDHDDQPQAATLTFSHRGQSAELIPGLPPVFTTLEVNRLENNIGYIRFDPFAPALTAPLLDAIHEMENAPGLIIDLRGNHGGNSDVGKRLIDAMVDQAHLIWTWTTRHGTGATYAEPSADPYDGLVVVLVDVCSGSASEAFAGGIQAMDRAVVVGERTSGRLLSGEIAELPIGALMIYPTAQPAMADGTIVEGYGVIPDLPVAVRRSDLADGIDPALRAAIEYILARS